MGRRALRKIQIGLEAVAGTEVNATEIWRGLGVIDDQTPVEFAEEDVGLLPRTDRSYIPYVLANLRFEDVAATYEQLPYILACGVENVQTGSADGTGSGKVYQYDFPTTQENSICTATLEAGDNQQEEQFTYGFVENFQIHGAAQEAVMMNADWAGRQVAPGTFTAALTLDSVEEILFQKGTFYLDTSGGTFGGTQKTSTVLAFDFSMNTGWIPAFTGDGNLYFTFKKNVGPEATLTVTFEHDATAVAVAAANLAETEQLARVKVEGSALTTSDGYTYKTLIIDLAGKWSEVSPLGDQDGNDIRTGTLTGRYNVTASDYGKIIVVNEVANL